MPSSTSIPHSSPNIIARPTCHGETVANNFCSDTSIKAPGKSSQPLARRKNVVASNQQKHAKFSMTKNAPRLKGTEAFSGWPDVGWNSLPMVCLNSGTNTFKLEFGVHLSINLTLRKSTKPWIAAMPPEMNRKNLFSTHEKPAPFRVETVVTLAGTTCHDAI